MKKCINSYNSVYDDSIFRAEEFWEAYSKQAVSWIKEPDSILLKNDSDYYNWFAGSEVNTCFHAVDIHLDNGLGDKVAIIYDNPITGVKKKITYCELKSNVEKFAGVLRNNGVSKGDKVMIQMPMIAEGIYAMLACARIGAVHVVIFTGLTTSELTAWMNNIKPKLYIVSSYGYDNGKVVDYSSQVDLAVQNSKFDCKKVIVFYRDHNKWSNHKRYKDWVEEINQANPEECVPVSGTDLLYILHTSGSTTGKPKGIVRDNAGHIVGLKWCMENVYNLTEDDVYFAISDLAWIVGHSNIVYGPLFCGCTTVLYEGKEVGTPNAGEV